MKYIPHQYQADCLAFIEDHKKSALFLEMGLGKSVVVLTHIKDQILDHCNRNCTLIIAPKRVATVTWPAEIQKWDHTRALKFHVLHGKGKIPNPPDVDVLIMNYESLPWLIKQKHIFSRINHVVFDESTWLKNSGSKRWMLSFVMFSTCERITLLTGTPIPNGIMDLWSQIYLLDGGKRLGCVLTTFRDQYFHQDTFRIYQYYPLKGSLEKIVGKVQDIAMTLKAKDYLSMPPLIFNTVKVRMPDKAQKIYDNMERDFFVEIGGKDIAAFNAAALGSKLRQAAQGFMYDIDREPCEIHKAKAQALEEMLSSYPAENFLVATNFVYEIQQLLQRFPKSKGIYGATSSREGDETIKEWNDGKLKLLFAHPASIGHGLNLQDGGHMIVWMGPTWNLAHWLQFNARLHRQGQGKPVIVHTLIAEDTIDCVVAAGLQLKDTTQESLFERLIDYARTRSKN